MYMCNTTMYTAVLQTPYGKKNFDKKHNCVA